MDNKHKTYRIIRGLIFYFKAQEVEPSADEINRMWDSDNTICFMYIIHFVPIL